MNKAKRSIRDLISTYSIVAYDPENGQLGVGVQSHYFGVGSVVPWAEFGVGAVATQSFSEYTYGSLGLNLMRAGKSAQQALDSLLAGDPNREVRQVGMIDAKGNPAAHTGKKCIQAAGHRVGENYSVQANLMEKDTVWNAMADTFEAVKGDLADRILASLEAAEAEGGDIRGKQSVAILVVSEDQANNSSSGPFIKLDIEDHPDPLVEMRRLLSIAKAYTYAAKAGELLETKPLEKEHITKAEVEYKKARELMPIKDNPELVFWHAITLISINKIDDALPLFKEVFSIDPMWRELVPRLVQPELLPDDDAIINKIVSQ